MSAGPRQFLLSSNNHLLPSYQKANMETIYPDMNIIGKMALSTRSLQNSLLQVSLTFFFIRMVHVSSLFDVSVSAEYVDQLMNWVQGMLDDEAIFPNKIGIPFPKSFEATIKSIVRRLFRVYAHLYNHHFAQLCALSIEGAWIFSGYL